MRWALVMMRLCAACRNTSPVARWRSANRGEAAAIVSKNSKANRIETGERSGGIGEICSVEVDENSEENS